MGRLVLSVWRAIEHSPGFQALGQAWARHEIPGSAVLPPFVLGEGDGLPAEMEAAGFRGVQSTTASHLLRYPTLEEFVVPYVEATPMAQLWSQLDDPTRAALVRDVRAALVYYVEPGEEPSALAFPIETRYLTARA